MKKIIALAGEIACGKGTVVKYLEEKYGAKSIRFSTILRDVLTRLHLEVTRDNLQKLSTSLREAFTDDLLSKVIADDASGINSEIVLLDGARRMTDLLYLKELPGFKLVFVDTDIKLRYERIIQRGENADDIGKTFETFEKEQCGEAEMRIRELKDVADYVLDNNGTEEELKKQVDEMMKDLG